MPHTICKKHGHTEDVFKIQGKYYRCRECHRNYNREYCKSERAIKKRKFYNKIASKLAREKTKQKWEFRRQQRINAIPAANCKTHGYTTIISRAFVSKSGVPYYRCKICNQEKARQYMRDKKTQESALPTQ